MVYCLTSGFHLELISILVVAVFYVLLYVFSSRSPLFKVERDVYPYTAGVLYNGQQVSHVSDMIVFLSILLTIESLVAFLFFEVSTIGVLLLFAAALVAVILAYHAYLVGE